MKEMRYQKNERGKGGGTKEGRENLRQEDGKHRKGENENKNGREYKRDEKRG